MKVTGLPHTSAKAETNKTPASRAKCLNFFFIQTEKNILKKSIFKISSAFASRQSEIVHGLTLT